MHHPSSGLSPLGDEVEDPPGKPAPLPGAGRIVLLIEDDEDIRIATAECLEVEGFAVIGAESVDDGLAHLRGGISPAVILLDLMMPGRSGWDFRREQLADPALRNIPVIVLSASRIKPESLHQNMGEVVLVPKPFSSDALMGAIAHAISPAVGEAPVADPLPALLSSAGALPRPLRVIEGRGNASTSTSTVGSIVPNNGDTRRDL